MPSGSSMEKSARRNTSLIESRPMSEVSAAGDQSTQPLGEAIGEQEGRHGQAFEPRMEIQAAGEIIRRRNASQRESRAVRAATQRNDPRLDAEIGKTAFQQIQ